MPRVRHLPAFWFMRHVPTNWTGLMWLLTCFGIFAWIRFTAIKFSRLSCGMDDLGYYILDVRHCGWRNGEMCLDYKLGNINIKHDCACNNELHWVNSLHHWIRFITFVPESALSVFSRLSMAFRAFALFFFFRKVSIKLFDNFVSCLVIILML
jgi:hypothetical protein